MNSETYTKIFLKANNIAVNGPTIKEHHHLWFKNTRHREHTGGLRLTEEGFNMCRDIDLKLYEIPFYDKLRLTTQVLIFLDKFIDCPYFVTDKSVYVSGEKKAVELTMFSGNILKYGLIKAMKKTLGEDIDEAEKEGGLSS